MATTVNGYPVLAAGDYTGPLPRLRKWNLPGTDRHFILRDGVLGFVLMVTILWWHEKIERLDLGVWDEWGHAVRPVRGQTSGYSNHAGGVAADVNATRHPLGVAIAATFTAAQITRIRARILLTAGVIVWGGAWRRPDGMHLEVAEVAFSRVTKLARAYMLTRRGRAILDANPGARAVILS